MAFALDNLGYLANDRGDRLEAERLLSESLTLYRELGDKRGLAKALDTLGLVAMLHGDHERAGPLLEESLALARAIGNNWLIPLELAYLGLIAQVQGNTERAAVLFAESLALCQDRGPHLPAPRCLEGLAAVAAVWGRAERAARLFAVAQAMRDAIRGPMLPADRAIYEPIIARVRRQLGEAAFATAWAAGQTVPVEAAIDEALDVASAKPPDWPSARAAVERYGLSPRETEVLRLLATGCPDRAIADALFISHRTVHHHVASILTKLGVRARVEAARVAYDAGLLNDDATSPT